MGVDVYMVGHRCVATRKGRFHCQNMPFWMPVGMCGVTYYIRQWWVFVEIQRVFLVKWWVRLSPL